MSHHPLIWNPLLGKPRYEYRARVNPDHYGNCGLIWELIANDPTTFSTLGIGTGQTRELLSGAVVPFETDNADQTFKPFWAMGSRGPFIRIGYGSDYNSGYKAFLNVPDYVSSILNFKSAATLVMELRLSTAIPLSGYQALCGLGYSAGLETFYVYDGDSKFYSGIFHGGSTRDAFTCSASVDRTQWHQLAVVATPSAYLAYQNAILLGTGTTESTVTCSASSKIGKGWGGTNGWGCFDLCRFALYTRGLSQPELLELWNHPYGTPRNPRLLVEPRRTWFVPAGVIEGRTTAPFPIFFRP